MVEINETMWNDLVNIESSNEPMLVEVYSRTCVPCKLLAKELQTFEQEYGIKTYKIEAKTLERVEKALFDTLTGVPTLFFVSKGNELAVFVVMTGRKWHDLIGKSYKVFCLTGKQNHTLTVITIV